MMLMIFVVAIVVDNRVFIAFVIVIVVDAVDVIDFVNIILTGCHLHNCFHYQHLFYHCYQRRHFCRYFIVVIIMVVVLVVVIVVVIIFFIITTTCLIRVRGDGESEPSLSACTLGACQQLAGTPRAPPIRHLPQCWSPAIK